MSMMPENRSLADGHTVNDLLQLTGFDAMNKMARWQLIDVIEKKIRMLEVLLLDLQPGTDIHAGIKEKVVSLRLKWFEIWNSFHPKFNGRIQIGMLESNGH